MPLDLITALGSPRPTSYRHKLETVVEPSCQPHSHPGVVWLALTWRSWRYFPNHGTTDNFTPYGSVRANSFGAQNVSVLLS